MKTLTWTRNASSQLEKIYLHIENDSPQNAESVVLTILNKLDDIVGNEEKYPIDKYRKNNKGDFRAFELFRIRISYQILQDEILIVRIRSTSQKPLNY